MEAEFGSNSEDTPFSPLQLALISGGGPTTGTAAPTDSKRRKVGRPSNASIHSKAAEARLRSMGGDLAVIFKDNQAVSLAAQQGSAHAENFGSLVQWAPTTIGSVWLSVSKHCSLGVHKISAPSTHQGL